MAATFPATQRNHRQSVCTDLRLNTNRYDIGMLTRFLRTQGVDSEKLDVAHKLTCCAVEFCTAPEDAVYSIWFYASSDPLSRHIPILVCDRQQEGVWAVTQWNPKTYTPA